MTRGKALTILNLSSSASREEIGQAYQRLIRRYPPEFHPDKFRAIDEAYHFLTSLAFRIEKLLSPESKVDLDRKTFSFDLPPPVSSLEGAISEIKKQLKIAFLWSPLEEEDHGGKGGLG
jgi:curved DNA-binding protein CbpA